MQTAIMLLFLAVPLGGAAYLAYLRTRYVSTSAYRWKCRLGVHRNRLLRRRRELGEPSTLDARLRKLRADHFERHLRAVPVERLAQYSGIGPGTVDLLRGRGLVHLAHLQGAKFESIPTIGAVRGNLIRTAVDHLSHDAQAAFESGTFATADRYRREVAAMKAAEEERLLRRDAELANLDIALRECDALWNLARSINLYAYLTQESYPGIADAILDKPLPTAEAPAVVPVAKLAERVSAPAAKPPAAKAPDPKAKRESPPPAMADPSLVGKLRAVAAFGLVVAKADGRIAAKERAAVRQYLAEQFGHDALLVRFIDPTMEAIGKNIPTLEAALAAVLDCTSVSERLDLYRFAERIADAAGERNDREAAALRQIATRFELPSVTPAVVAAAGVVAAAPAPPKRPRGMWVLPPVANVAQAAEPAPQPAPEPKGDLELRSVLDIAADAALSAELIRRKYALLADKFDPKKVADLGADIVRQVEEKRRKVRQAAEVLIAPFGVPLDPPAARAKTSLRDNPDLDDLMGG